MFVNPLPHTDVELHTVAMDCLREVVIASPLEVSNELGKNIFWFKVY